jgi:carbamoyl-phosphate synthase large subunit
MKKRKISVLITGAGGAGSLGRELMKALNFAKNDYEIVVTNSSPLSVGLFENVKSYLIPSASSKNYINTILDICKKEQIDVVIGGSELEIGVLAKNYKIFSKNKILLLTNSLKIIKLCLDKLKLAEFLSNNKILCPKTFSFNKENDTKQIESYPVIVKPRTGSGSRNVFLANDEDEAIFFGNYIKKNGSIPIIQEYIDGFEEEFTIGVLYSDNGKLKTSIAMRRILEGSLSTRDIRESPKTKKKSVISSGFSQGYFDDFTIMKKLGEKIAKILDSDGPMNIQCRKTKKGIYIFEINPRFSGTVASRSLVGHNEPDMLIRYRIFNELPNTQKSKKGYVMKDLKEKFISLNDIKNLKEL